MRLERVPLHRVEVLSFACHRHNARADLRLESVHQSVVFGEAVLGAIAGHISGQQVALVRDGFCGPLGERRRVCVSERRSCCRDALASAALAVRLLDARENTRCLLALQLESAACASFVPLLIVSIGGLTAQRTQPLVPFFALLFRVDEML